MNLLFDLLLVPFWLLAIVVGWAGAVIARGWEAGFSKGYKHWGPGYEPVNSVSPDSKHTASEQN
jgi:hypothetical protein